MTYYSINYCHMYSTSHNNWPYIASIKLISDNIRGCNSNYFYMLSRTVDANNTLMGVYYMG